MVAASQAHGGIAQGARQALLEGAQYDSDSGQVLAGSFMDDALPRADDLVPIQLGFNPTRCTRNPLGVKGRAWSVLSRPSRTRFWTRWHTRVHEIDGPAISCRVWRAMRAGKERAG